MGKITAYQATDGKVFVERKAYVEYERNLVAGKRLTALVDEKGTAPAELASAVAAFYRDNMAAVREIVLSKDISLDGKDESDSEGDAPEAAAAEVPAPLTAVEV